MCLLVLAHQSHPRYALILASNRDEFLDRPAVPAHFWPDSPGILAGRDQQARGTWMGISIAGRFAVITNYRDLRNPIKGSRSRGLLVWDKISGREDDGAHQYDGYNLISGEIGALRYQNNINGAEAALAPGIHGLSNHVLDTPWPKVRRALALFDPILSDHEPSVSDLFELLKDDKAAPDADLPDTGLGLERERALSPIFIRTPGYGTRVSTVVLVGHDGHVRFEERNHHTGQTVREEFDIAGS